MNTTRSLRWLPPKSWTSRRAALAALLASARNRVEHETQTGRLRPLTYQPVIDYLDEIAHELEQ